MKERCRDGCRTSLLIAGVVLVLAIFHTSLPLCHPYITIHFMEMIFSTCINRDGQGPPHHRYMGYNGQFSSLPRSCLTLITQNGRDGVGVMSCEYAGVYISQGYAWRLWTSLGL